MCVCIDQDIENFATAIGNLERGPRVWSHEDEHAYALRKDVCEKSRFVWVSAMEAADRYEGVLENCGSPDASTRAQRIDHLFRQAVDLLSCQQEDFYQRVSARHAELQGILQASLAASAAASG